MTAINRTGHLGVIQKISTTAVIGGLLTAAALKALGASNKWQYIAIGTSALGLVGRLSTEPTGRYLDRQLVKTPKHLETASQATRLNQLFVWGATGALKTIESRILQAAKEGRKDIVEILAICSGGDVAIRGAAAAGLERVVNTLKDEVSVTSINKAIVGAAKAAPQKYHRDAAER